MKWSHGFILVGNSATAYLATLTLAGSNLARIFNSFSIVAPVSMISYNKNGDIKHPRALVYLPRLLEHSGGDVRVMHGTEAYR